MKLISIFNFKIVEKKEMGREGIATYLPVACDRHLIQFHGPAIARTNHLNRLGFIFQPMGSLVQPGAGLAHSQQGWPEGPL